MPIITEAAVMDMEQALLDPASVFANPAAVCDAPTLTAAQKVEILRRWEYDARELQVADEENMTGDGSSRNATDLLSQVLAALHRLDANEDLANSPPTKQ